MRRRTIARRQADKLVAKGKSKSFRVTGEVYSKGKRYINLVHIKTNRPRTVMVKDASDEHTD